MAKYKVVDVPGRTVKGIQVTTHRSRASHRPYPTRLSALMVLYPAKGAMTLFISGTTGDAISKAHKAATNGEAATQPVNPDLVITEKGEPEVAENPELQAA